MYIHHFAVWVKDLEVMKDFYLKYFNCTSNEKYTNPQKGFSSYFISFENGSKIELMHRPQIHEMSYHEMLGLAHFAINVRSKNAVNQLTAQLENDGFRIEGYPRTTGDGYYESVFLDPEGNKVELVG